MEKLSLYDLLSFLLPGSIVTVVIWYIGTYYFPLDNSKLISELNSIVFIAASFFIGSVIHYLFEWSIIKVILQRLFLLESISEIYNTGEIKPYIKEFYEPKLKYFGSMGYDDYESQIEELWSSIYFKLEAEDKISIPKSFQSFYFFFRNVAILCILFLLIGLLLFILNLCCDVIQVSLIYLLMILLFLGFILGLSIVAGRMHRRKMVERMFWIYYSLYNKNSPLNN